VQGEHALELEQALVLRHRPAHASHHNLHGVGTDVILGGSAREQISSAARLQRTHFVPHYHAHTRSAELTVAVFIIIIILLIAALSSFRWRQSHPSQ
jgi:hypothetical protein